MINEEIIEYFGEEENLKNEDICIFGGRKDE